MNNALLYVVEIQLCGIPGQLCDLLIWTLIIPSSSRYIVSVATYSILDASRGISNIQWNRGVLYCARDLWGCDDSCVMPVTAPWELVFDRDQWQWAFLEGRNLFTGSEVSRFQRVVCTGFNGVRT